MPRRGHTEEQILRALHQAERGAKVSEICCEHGIGQQTYYIWKKNYAGLRLSELRELRQLREENGKLKRLVADRHRTGTVNPGGASPQVVRRKSF